MKTIICHHMLIAYVLLGHFSLVQLFVTPWAVAHQAPLSVGFSRQEYWSGLPCCLLEDRPNPGIKLHLLHLPHCRRILYPVSHFGSPC